MNVKYVQIHFPIPSVNESGIGMNISAIIPFDEEEFNSLKDNPCFDSIFKATMHQKEQHKFIITAFSTGIGFTALQEALLKYNIKTPSLSSVYVEQKELLCYVEQLATNNMSRYKNTDMTIAISFDGSWVSRRESKFCVGTLCDIEKAAVLAYHIITNDIAVQGSKLVTVIEDCASKIMEGEAFQELLNIPIWSNVDTFVIDGDVCCTKALIERGYQCRVVHDPNHLIKNSYIRSHV